LKLLFTTPKHSCDSCESRDLCRAVTQKKQTFTARVRQMETYCSALLNQEKSLEELQRHLRTTEVCAGQPLWHDSHLVALLSLPLRDLIDLGDVRRTCSASR